MPQFQDDTSTLHKGRSDKARDIFMAEMLDSRADRWAVDYLHRTDGNRCPHCGTDILDAARLKRWYQGERIKCSSPACGRFYTSRTNTRLEGSTLGFKEFYLLKCLSEWGVPAATIVTIIPINKETVDRWEKRFQAMESVSA